MKNPAVEKRFLSQAVKRTSQAMWESAVDDLRLVEWERNFPRSRPDLWRNKWKG